MKKNVLFSLILVFTAILLKAQDVKKELMKTHTVSVSTGVFSQYKVIDGYYFSFDVAFPLSKSIAISPTFTYFSSNPNKLIWINQYNGTTEINTFPNKVPNGEHGLMGSAIDVLFLFKPLNWFENVDLKKHELIIGTGFGYKSYTSVDATFHNQNNTIIVDKFIHKSEGYFAPHYIKMNYNRHLSKNTLIGAVFSINSIDGEGILLTGIQLSVNF